MSKRQHAQKMWSLAIRVLEKVLQGQPWALLLGRLQFYLFDRLSCRLWESSTLNRLAIFICCRETSELTGLFFIVLMLLISRCPRCLSRVCQVFDRALIYSHPHHFKNRNSQRLSYWMELQRLELNTGFVKTVFISFIFVYL